MRAGGIPAVLAAVAVAAFASSASAQEFSLSPSPTITGGNVTFSGSAVNLQQVISISCAVSATLNVIGGAGSNTANLSSESILPGASLLCGAPFAPVPFWSAQTKPGWTLPGSGSAKITVIIGVTGVVNDPCYPQAVEAQLDTPISGSSTLTFNNVVLQAASARADRQCRINGVLTATGMTNNRVFIH